MKERTTYTAADLARYHAGGMSPREMHELEKAALADPFLSDALEGYETTPHAADEVAELRTQLNKRVARRKIFSLSAAGDQNWFRIAAVVIVFAGIAFLITRTLHNDHITSDRTLADNKTLAPPPVSKTPPPTIATPTEKPVETEQAPQAKIPLTTDKVPKPAKTEQAAQPTEDGITRSSQPSNAGRQPTTPTGSHDAAANYFRENKGSISDFNGQDRSIKKEAKSLQESNAGNEKPEGEITTSSAQTSATASPADHQNAATMPIAANAAPSDILKQEMKKANPEAKDRAGMVMQNANTQPADSVQFNQYLDTAKRALPAADSVRDNGKVILSFTVNNTGRPDNIVVEKSLCDACDRAAIELLKKGPAWINVAGKKRTVTVTF